MSTTEMRRIFSELNRANLERVPMEHLVARFRAASKGTSVPIKMGSGGELYLRARRWNGPRLERVEKLGAPPADLVEGYQRCNSPGVPMFYAASKRIVALLESRAKVGDVVYLSHWVQNGQLAINGLLLPPMDGDKARNAFDDMFALQLDTLFTRRVHEDSVSTTSSPPQQRSY